MNALRRLEGRDRSGRSRHHFRRDPAGGVVPVDRRRAKLAKAAGRHRRGMPERARSAGDGADRRSIGPSHRVGRGRGRRRSAQHRWRRQLEADRRRASYDPDIHDIAVAVNGGTTVLTSTPREIFASTDRGDSWRGLGVGDQFGCATAAAWRRRPTTRRRCSSRPATARSAAPARSSARRTADGAGRRCRCRSSPIRRSGRSRRIPPNPTGSSPAAITASLLPVMTPAIPGRSCAANSPKSAPSAGSRGDLRGGWVNLTEAREHCWEGRISTTLS